MAKNALLCPGQGAQFVGMGKELAESIPACGELYRRASEVLGFDLADVSFHGPIEKLTVSANAQPAIFVHSVAAWTAWTQRHPEWACDCAAGLSSGEWTALYLAGVVSFEDALRILEARGRFMTEACNRRPGGMISIIGATPEQIDRLCAESGLEKANLNSQEQIVLSGPIEGVQRAETLARDMGIRKAIRLNVAGAFHSTLMREAADRLAETLNSIEFREPAFPVYSNVTARPHTTPEEIRRLMVAQVYSPVRWLDSIEAMKADGVTHYLECGPGKVLSGLVKRIDKGAILHSIQDLSGLNGAS
ncbi:MAG: ACP S-malonyltransferase [Kiritimatiellae bacterium]|nr:ACP S-malonyltransferase [Kiritimatiellia bacterium]MDW8458307.1 ACP S-malonyltransferase [Verrucomicrobiota bacterium]